MNGTVRPASCLENKPERRQDWDAVLQIFDALASCVILLDSGLLIRAVNSTFLDLAGLSRSELDSRPAELLEPLLPGLREQLAELCGCGPRMFHTRLTDKNGVTHLLEISLARMDSGMTVCVGCGFREQHGGCQEAALRRTEQQLVAANRLKRKFIANINHAIRTPMNAIIGYAEILAESGLSEQQQRFVSTIRKNGTALVSIISDVMELSKLESGSVKVLKSAANLRAVVEQAADLFADQIRAKKLDFACEVEPCLPEMYVMDADHCRQVLINLISNAVKFTEKGKVCLTVTGLADGDGCWELVFQVEDTGIGLSSSEQEALRELFGQQEEQQISIHDGTRLGLTLCARLARMMGGVLQIESTHGHGSLFTFIMPAQAAERGGTAGFSVRRSQPPQTRRANPVMLVVDDMPEMSHLVKIYFKNSAIRVLEAAGPEDCLSLALGERPDLILMDLDLAGTDGRDLARQLKENPRTKGIPIVAMTGFLLEKDSLAPIFDDLLTKPFHLQELRQVVRRHIQVGQSGAPPSSLVGQDDPARHVSGLRAAWNSGLEAACTQAQMSGNLEDACALGRKLEESGHKSGSAELAELGRKMQRFAMDIDIRGMEQVLSLLRSVAEERE